MKCTRSRAVALAVSLACLAFGPATARSGAMQAAPADAQRAHEAALVAWALAVHEPRASDADELKRAWERTRDFYARRDQRPAWLDDGGAAAARTLAARMRASAEDGLEPTAYNAAAREAELDAHRSAGAPEAAAPRVDADVRFTLAAFRFASDLALGRWGGAASDRALDLVALLHEARDAEAAERVLSRLEPAHPEYRLLRRHLAAYRQIAANGGWPAVPPDLRRTTSGPRAKAAAAGVTPRDTGAALRARLAASGDLPGSPAGSVASDAALQAAVRRFQERHGLPSTGIADRATVDAMNVGAETRARQIALNMDRWRRLPQDLGARHVRMNTPEFTLRLYSGGQPVGAMKVVAGEPATPTPILSDVISYLEFQPYWNVPESIALSMLPKIAADPGYLAARQMEVVRGWEDTSPVVPAAKVPWKTLTHGLSPYRIRQRPGPANGLGLVKFMFPNVYSVYLHDTPSRDKFVPRERAFSNGCVRVEHPVRLAEFLFGGDPRWPREAILKAMRTGGRKVIDLPAPVPVHLTYFTAWSDGDQMQFRADLYGWDRAESLVMPAKMSQ